MLQILTPCAVYRWLTVGMVYRVCPTYSLMDSSPPTAPEQRNVLRPMASFQLWAELKSVRFLYLNIMIMMFEVIQQWSHFKVFECYQPPQLQSVGAMLVMLGLEITLCVFISSFTESTFPVLIKTPIKLTSFLT